MILVDTSAWIEFLRATQSPVHFALRQLIADDAPIATTDVVVMELLSGARSETRAQELRRLLLSFIHLPVRGLVDFEASAEVYRDCRRRGFTPRTLSDCLIAAVAIRAECSLLHHDRDYIGIGQCTALQLFE